MPGSGGSGSRAGGGGVLGDHTIWGGGGGGSNTVTRNTGPYIYIYVIHFLNKKNLPVELTKLFGGSFNHIRTVVLIVFLLFFSLVLFLFLFFLSMYLSIERCVAIRLFRPIPWTQNPQRAPFFEHFDSSATRASISFAHVFLLSSVRELAFN